MFCAQNYYLTKLALIWYLRDLTTELFESSVTVHVEKIEILHLDKILHKFGNRASGISNLFPCSGENTLSLGLVNSWSSFIYI